ncbi:succinate dehydrogenase, partial [candidate division KSB1 bacterium]
HAIWSSFQSLGIGSPRFTPFWYTVGLIWAIVIAVGFIFLPLWIYFTGTGGAL